jgi:hypothetical protein
MKGSPIHWLVLGGLAYSYASFAPSPTGAKSRRIRLPYLYKQVSPEGEFDPLNAFRYLMKKDVRSEMILGRGPLGQPHLVIIG